MHDIICHKNAAVVEKTIWFAWFGFFPEFWGDTDKLLTSLADDFRKLAIFHSSVAWQPQGLPAIVPLGPESASQSLDIVLVCTLACVTSVLDGVSVYLNALEVGIHSFMNKGIDSRSISLMDRFSIFITADIMISLAKFAKLTKILSLCSCPISITFMNE